MDEMLRQVLTDTLQMSEEDMGKIAPEMEGKIKNVIVNSGRYRVVAEVVSSKYCLAGLTPGQKYVVEGGVINTSETTAPLCLAALAPLFNHVFAWYDRIASDSNITEPMMGFRCVDPGLSLGGLGKVEFAVKVEEMA
jgi:uncharacterized repeat protein (TIGR04076 family)